MLLIFLITLTYITCQVYPPYTTAPTGMPTMTPSVMPTTAPTGMPTMAPSTNPSVMPTLPPTVILPLVTLPQPNLNNTCVHPPVSYSYKNANMNVIVCPCDLRYQLNNPTFLQMGFPCDSCDNPNVPSSILTCVNNVPVIMDITQSPPVKFSKIELGYMNCNQTTLQFSHFMPVKDLGGMSLLRFIFLDNVNYVPVRLQFT